MALLKKIIEVEAKIGDIIKSPGSIFRDDLDLYIIAIKGDLLYVSTHEGDSIENCEVLFVEDCYLV